MIVSLGGKCARCGIDDLRVLELHHIDPSQKVKPDKRQYNWAHRLKDWDANTENLELLCANCHRLQTWEDRGWGVGLEHPVSVSLQS